jgi:hypothetical protein
MALYHTKDADNSFVALLFDQFSTDLARNSRSGIKMFGFHNRRIYVRLIISKLHVYHIEHDLRSLL